MMRPLTKKELENVNQRARAMPTHWEKTRNAHGIDRAVAIFAGMDHADQEDRRAWGRCGGRALTRAEEISMGIPRPDRS